METLTKIEPNFVDGAHGQLQFHRCGFLIVSSIDNRSRARQRCSASSKKVKSILIQKESFAMHRLLVLLWSGHGIIPKFTVSFSYLNRKSPWFPSCHLIQNASSSFRLRNFSKQKGEDDDSQRCFWVWLLLCYGEVDDALLTKFTRRCYFFGAIYLSPKFTLAWVMTIR